MILDELDSGVGSRLGQPVAAMLRRMTAAPSGAGHGTATQILCVSHIPQVRDYSPQRAGYLKVAVHAIASVAHLLRQTCSK